MALINPPSFVVNVGDNFYPAVCRGTVIQGFHGRTPRLVFSSGASLNTCTKDLASLTRSGSGSLEITTTVATSMTRGGSRAFTILGWESVGPRPLSITCGLFGSKSTQPTSSSSTATLPTRILREILQVSAPRSTARRVVLETIPQGQRTLKTVTGFFRSCGRIRRRGLKRNCPNPLRGGRFL